ncbi:ABC1 kinase family protein [Heyndrickxia coagulans]|uniref:ABC1 kinase family protein n=1 Tax=Heyndrickxia coagulans TaxID=1398 RepID=UPI000779C7DD|nr:AarF/ABC1/UbiB kinase family protein [Heyndrickxia coagulans]KYC59037.1 hypothetical protein B4100_3538 [Heyndrickxia coagulans]
MLSRKMKHGKRYQEIAGALIKNGLGYLISDWGLSDLLPFPSKKAAPRTPHRSTGERIRLFLEELGPTFIKLGQLASSRRDILPESIIADLEKLQDKATPFPFEEVKKIIRDEFGAGVEELFAEFDPEPLATASIGQVHKAKLHTEEPVAIKIQRPNIRPVIETDLEILESLSLSLESRFEWARAYQLRDIVEEFSQALLSELDYYHEGRNAERIAKQFEGDENIRIPKIYWDFSTKRVLTMEYIKGRKISEFFSETVPGYRKKAISERLIHSMLQQIFVEGFFHGDPHPGNIVVLPGDVICYMDFGMVGRLTEETKYHCASLVIALMRADTNAIMKSVDALAEIPEETDLHLLKEDVEVLREKYYDLPLSQSSLREAINDLYHLAFKYHIRFPADLTILGKSLITVEGVVESLDPEFSLIEAARPFGERLLRDRLRPGRVAQKGWKTFLDQAEILLELPKNLRDISKTMRKGKFRMEVVIPDLHLFLEKLDRISNRLSFAIVLLAFSILMVGLMIGTSISGQSTVIWKNPIIEIGFGVATLMLLWLLLSIFKSGKF